MMVWLRREAWTGQTDDDAKNAQPNFGAVSNCNFRNVKFSEYYFIGKTQISKYNV